MTRRKIGYRPSEARAADPTVIRVDGSALCQMAKIVQLRHVAVPAAVACVRMWGCSRNANMCCSVRESGGPCFCGRRIYRGKQATCWAWESFKANLQATEAIE